MERPRLSAVEGQTLAVFGDGLLAYAQARRMDDGVSPLDERNARLLREILDGVRVGSGQTAHLARYPIEGLLGGKPFRDEEIEQRLVCPEPSESEPTEGPEPSEPEPTEDFHPVVMATHTMAIQNDSVSDDSFVRRARETVRDLMAKATVFFVYGIIVHPATADGARAWSIRCGRWRR